MKTLFVTDLDGTLLTGAEKVSVYSRERINRLIGAGLSFTYATARSAESAFRATEGLDVNMPAILYNGGLIYNFRTRETLRYTVFEEEWKRYVFTVLKEYGIFPIVFGALTKDDAHIFMLPEQITEEIKGVVRIIDEVYSLFGFKYHVELSTRPENSMGSDEDWENATNALVKALDELKLPYVVNEGDGAFYGPKIDFHLEDCIGRTWQCGTIQLDFQMPQRFDLEYVGEDGEKHRPIMIHRVVFGSIERFIGILIEHYAGKFPVWLSPVQVKVLPITDRAADYAAKLTAEMNAMGLRAEADLRKEKLGKKIADAEVEKVPYKLVVGDKEVENGTVSIRKRGEGDIGAMAKEEFFALVKKENDEKIVF